MSASLNVRDIHVEYGARVALSGVSLAVEAGQIVALVGSNGAGKTSTLRAITGLRPPSRGEIVLDGARIDQLAPPSIVARGVALSPEGRRVFPRMTVHDNLLIGGFLQRDSRALHANVERMFLHFPKLRQRRSQFAGSLSGGEQQMLAIARALMTNPALLLLDEPMEGLAPIIVEELAAAIRTMIAEEGVAVILIDQHAELALSLTRDAAIMERGAIVHRAPSAELLRDAATLDRYIGLRIGETA